MIFKQCSSSKLILKQFLESTLVVKCDIWRYFYTGVSPFNHFNPWQLFVCLYTNASHRSTDWIKFSCPYSIVCILRQECHFTVKPNYLEEILDHFPNSAIFIRFGVCVYWLSSPWVLYLFNYVCFVNVGVV